MLGNFATVDEVKAAVGDVVVWGEMVPQLGSFAPLHYSVHDAGGKSIVIEYVDGKLHVYDNAVGVLTNSPTYEWHIQNLRNYVNLTAENAKPVKIGNVTYAGTGQGSGLHGLPGDPTPPSRFVMAAATAYLVEQAEGCRRGADRRRAPDQPRRHPQGPGARLLAKAASRPATTRSGPRSATTPTRSTTGRPTTTRRMRAVDLKTLDFDAGQPTRSLSIAAAKPTVQMVSPAQFSTATQ